MALEVKKIAAGYGITEVLHGISLRVDKGEVVSVIGHNGAGKTTLLKTIAGLIMPVRGSIKWDGADITGVPPDKRVRTGISMVPEGRRVFAESTVYENIEIGAFTRKDKAGIREDMERYLERFPILQKRRGQKAGVLSGGEQQMLAIVRAMMSRPRLLLLDEPSMGLSPAALLNVYETISEIRKEGTSILLVEQNAEKALEVSDRTYAIVNGKITYQGNSRELTQEEIIEKAFA